MQGYKKENNEEQNNVNVNVNAFKVTERPLSKLEEIYGGGNSSTGINTNSSNIPNPNENGDDDQAVLPPNFSSIYD